MSTPLSTRENSPTVDSIAEIASQSSLQCLSKASFKKLKTLDFKGEWVFPEVKNYHEDLNTIFFERNLITGEYQGPCYQVLRERVATPSRPAGLLHTQLLPDEPPRAQISIIHGLEDHSGHYLTLAEYFVMNGFLVNLIDLNGFGSSELVSSGTFSVEEYHRDFSILLSRSSKTLPLFILAQGFGASIALSYLQRNRTMNVAGVIISSAMIKCPESYKKSFLADLLLGEENVMVCSRVNPTALSKNNYKIRNHLIDESRKDFIHMKLINTIKNLESFILPNASAFNYPVLSLLNKKNGVYSNIENVKFFDRVASKDKEIKVFENGYLNIFDDAEREEAKKTVLDWCKARMRIAKPFSQGDSEILGIPKRRSKRKLMILLLILGVFLANIMKMRNGDHLMKMLARKTRKSMVWEKMLEVGNMLTQPFKI